MIPMRAKMYAVLAFLLLALLLYPLGPAIFGSGFVSPVIAAPKAAYHPVHTLTVLASSASPLFGVVRTTISTITPPVSHLLITHDFVHYRRITLPALPTPTERKFPAGYGSASFPTETDGWVVAGTTLNVYLYHTNDGGTTWQLARKTLRRGAGDEATVYFIDPTHGWLLSGAFPSFTFVKTSDGGQTWQPVSDHTADPLYNGITTPTPSFAMPTFSDPLDGYKPNTTQRDEPKGGTTVRTTVVITHYSLAMTVDAGATWVTTSPPVAGHGVARYLQPTFFGPDGVLPISVGAYRRQHPIIEGSRTTKGRVRLYFDSSQNGGPWTPTSMLQTTATGRSPTSIVSVTTPSAWWVLSEAPSRRLSIFKTTDAGKEWTRPALRGLPTTLRTGPHNASWIASIQAVSANVAFATISGRRSLHPGSRTVTTFLTTDGGEHWSRFTRAGP